MCEGVSSSQERHGAGRVVGELGRFRVHISMVSWSSQEELSSALWSPHISPVQH